MNRLAPYDPNTPGPEEVIRIAEGLGYLCIPQFYAVTIAAMGDGSEWAVPVGPLRYFQATAQRDQKASDKPTTVTWLVQFNDPQNDPDALDEHQRRIRAREAERRGE